MDTSYSIDKVVARENDARRQERELERQRKEI